MVYRQRLPLLSVILTHKYLPLQLHKFCNNKELCIEIYILIHYNLQTLLEQLVLLLETQLGRNLAMNFLYLPNLIIDLCICGDKCLANQISEVSMIQSCFSLASVLPTRYERDASNVFRTPRHGKPAPPRPWTRAAPFFYLFILYYIFIFAYW